METLVKEKILEQFVNNINNEETIKKPQNISISTMNVTNNMAAIKTLTSNDGNYFIRYGGYATSGVYNAIEVYSIDSLHNNSAKYIFNNIKINNNSVYIKDLKQDEDGRFYGIGSYIVSSVEYFYLIIFNNFIQDGFIKINKYYAETNMNIPGGAGPFLNVAKDTSGNYYINATNKIVKFAINIVDGNTATASNIVEGGTITDGMFRPQLSVFGTNAILTKLWETDDHKYEYKKATININEDMPDSVTLKSLFYTELTANEYVLGANNDLYECSIPALKYNMITFYNVDLNGGVTQVECPTKFFNSPLNLYGYLKGDYASVTDGSKIYLFYYTRDSLIPELIEFYEGSFTGNFTNTQILTQYNINTLIGTVGGSTQKIVTIKNIYSINTTSLPYYTDMFCLPAYMNLYSDSNDSTSLIFSRDATARFYSGNQVTSTFIVPNYLLNDGNIKKASIYGKTNYLLNDTVEDYEKNRFESLYFNFIYNLNVIDNTNGLNSLNQIGSNRIADTLWKSFIPMLSRLSKARITHEDLSREIIRLNLVSLIGGTATFNYQVSGNIVKIEYLSEDERTVYSTYRGQITGNHTITQVVKIIPNETATLSGTSIYISDSSNLTFANIQINGNSVQDGTPTTSSPIAIKNSGDSKNIFYLPDSNSSNGITYSVNDDGTFYLYGTATANTIFYIYKDLLPSKLINGQKYTLSSITSLTSGVEIRLEAYNGTTWQRHVLGGVLNSSTQIRTGAVNLSSTTRIRYSVYVANGTTLPFGRIYGIQLEKGDTRTSFAPEGKGFINETISNSDNTQSQSYTIPCQQAMRSIDNVRDEFIKQDGLWYEKHNIGVIESYNGETITTDFISTTGNLSTGAFIQYVLDDANYIECTQEQAQALESIIRAYTYDPITNINSTDETPAYLNVTYYKQL